MVKMVKMGCRGYLVGNGFSRFLRHSPTTNDSLHFSYYCVNYLKHLSLPIANMLQN